jgi:hypothetical protein
MVNTRPSPLCQNRSASLAFALLTQRQRVVHVPVAGKSPPKTMHDVKTSVEPD